MLVTEFKIKFLAPPTRITPPGGGIHVPWLGVSAPGLSIDKDPKSLQMSLNTLERFISGYFQLFYHIPFSAQLQDSCLIR